MYKMITFDIDGTLVQHLNHELKPEIKEMFKKLKEKGYIVTLATGRDFNSIANIHKTKNIDFFIGANGTFIYDLNKNKFLFNSTINFDDFKKYNDDVLMRYLDEIKNIVLSDINNVYVLEKNDNPKGAWFWDEFRHKFKDYKLAESEINKDNFHLITIEHSLNSKIEKISKDYFSKNNLSIEVQASWPKGLFVANKNINKANSIKLLCKHLDINIKEVIAFGDGENDMEMIKEVGLGVAMANSNDELKKIADDITVDVEEIGTKYYLEKIGII